MALRLMPCSPRRRIRLVTVAGRLMALRPRLGSQHLRRLDTSNGCQDHAVLPYAAVYAKGFDGLFGTRPAEALAKAESAPFVLRALFTHGIAALQTFLARRRCRVHHDLSQRS